MAGLTSSSRLQDPEFFDYSRSHRAVPVPPRTSTSKRRSPPQHYTTEEEREVLSRSSSRKRDRLLHRVSHSNLLSKPPAPTPPSPTRIVQTGTNYHAQVPSTSSSGTGGSDLTTSFPAPPTAGNHTQNNNNNNLHRNFSKKGATTMLRKFSSSGRQDARALQQQQQNQQQAQHQQLQTPRAPPPQLPNIHDFHSDTARPDSFGIFGTQNPSPAPLSALPSPPSIQQAPANFSRPGAPTMPSSSNTSSSSPAYALRTGNAFAMQQSSSSSPLSSGLGGGGESMAHRGRMSYAGTNNSQTGNHGHATGGGGGGVVSPRRIRRRKDPTPFNILVIGAKNSGKTSFISFLQHSFSLPSNQTNNQNHTSTHHTTSPTPSASHLHTTSSKPHTTSSASFTPTFLESEIDGERIGLTLWDSAGLEKHIIDLQLREISTFVEQKFEETFVEEQKVNRAPGVKDSHIHCVLLVLDPVRLDGTIAGAGVGGRSGEGKGALMVEGLDEDMDLQVLRALWGKTTVFPVVSKGDTVTVGHMAFLKRAVWRSVKGAKLDPLEALELDEEEDEDEDDEDEDGVEGEGSAIVEEDEGEGSDVVGDGRRSDGEDGSSASDSSPDLPTAKVVSNKRGTNGHTRQSSLANAGVTANGGPMMMMEEEPYIPFSVLSPDTDSYPSPPHHTLHNQGTPINGRGTAPVKVGRHFPWGFADPNDPLHCDFTRLRDSVFSEWRSDLRDLARTKWYENWRTSRLKNLPGTGRQRVSGRGGITPVAVVPKEGRSVGVGGQAREGRVGGSAAGGNGGGLGGYGGGLGSEGVPRSVSSGGGNEMGSEGGRGSGKAERMMGISSAAGQEGMGGGGRASGGMMRGVESYQ
ncbi:hypothetical protein LTR56_014751 [Elasticomyces elasticus]|nr:hypothetical protein LTR56_014751 [Elasticomyces elasticus]KAK3645451.1 hypothetical protein LTR22_014713 [Elasticomyces elasticus]KAK4915807.1 hypothetical protein LTR49_016065 [Elasticomyces elasticus]KAK5755598.1 hypothetical protein LTS12_014354 [Elasticomyces elasticus]